MKRSILLTVCVFAVAMLSDTAVGQTTKTVYFVRHAEDQVALYPYGKAFIPDCTPFLNQGVADECCTEVVNPIGAERVKLLTQWFSDKGLLPSITHVLASHKIRTLQTVQPIAHAAGLDADVNGDGIPDGTDIDKNPGDGVQQLPAFVDECERGFEIAHNFYPLIVDELKSLPLGSGIVVAGHSASLYPIMENLGIDTSDSARFPKNAVGRVRGYNNLWIVELDENNHGHLVLHVRMNLGLAVEVTP